MNHSTIKYIVALLLFGSNGIVASLISLNSYEIVLFRTLIGSVFLLVLYLVSTKRFTFFHHKKSFHKKAEGIVGLENATLQLSVAFLSVFIFVLMKQGIHINIQTPDILPLIFLGLINTGIGCFLYFSSIGNIKVQSVAILGYLEPLSAIFFSFIFLKEQLLPLQILGAVLIIVGAIFAELRKKI